MALSPTPLQLAALRFIHGYHLAHGRSPTLTEIAVGTGLYGKPSAKALVDQLKERGLATYTPKVPRSVELVARPPIPFAPDGAPLFLVPGIGERG